MKYFPFFKPIKTIGNTEGPYKTLSIAHTEGMSRKGVILAQRGEEL